MKQVFTRVAVKVGSNVLTRRDGTLDVTRMSALVDQIAELYKSGVEIILISSGAVASGRSEVSPQKKLDSVDQRQLFSAVGQAKLINRYYELFREHNIPVGQVLTTKESFGTRRHYLNQKNCMTVMLANGVIPIVNENDTTFDGCKTAEDVEAILKGMENGTKVGSQTGTTGAKYISGDVDDPDGFGFEGFKNLTLQNYETHADAVRDMVNGTVAFCVVDNLVAAQIVAQINAAA